MRRMISGALAVVWLALVPSAAQKTPGFGFKGGEFVLNGKPFRIMAGKSTFSASPASTGRTGSSSSGRPD